jgi:enamine deaminase RidA (YjgF/YER057c/UK114 family)
MTAVNESWKRHFGDRLPARSSLFVSRLKNADMLVEIEAVGHVG